jgi:hypothetical protein
MSEVDQRTRYERLFDVFCSIKPLPKERLDWIEWLCQLSAHLSFVCSDLVAVTEPERMSAARFVLELIYNDPRGATPWGHATPRTSQPEAMLDKLDRAILFEMLERSGHTLEALHKLLDRWSTAADKLGELGERGSAWFQSPVFTDAFRDALLGVAPTEQPPKTPSEARPAAPPARRVGTEPHNWVEQGPLQSGRPMFFCDHCQRSIMPEPNKLAEALAIHDCTGRVH